MNFAYIRVSLSKQNDSSQLHSINQYCNARNIKGLSIFSDVVSGSIHWRQRELASLLATAKPGDTIYISEVSRIGRSTLQVLEFLAEATAKLVNIFIVKQDLALDGSLTGTIAATILGLAAQIERDIISERTKAGMAVAMANGAKPGRPVGFAPVLKLDSQLPEIRRLLALGVGNNAISKIVGANRKTVLNFIKRRKLGKYRAT